MADFSSYGVCHSYFRYGMEYAGYYYVQISLQRSSITVSRMIGTQIFDRFKKLLSDHLKRSIEDTLLHFRYWMDEPGDDVMWFFSENHTLLFHICQYLSGKYLPNETFRNSGLSGRESGRVTGRMVWSLFVGIYYRMEFKCLYSN